jgi:DNA-binding Lrp family transcriptional regulator
MANDLKMHRNTISSRLRELFKDKVILKKSVIIDPKYYTDIGTGFTALVTIDARVGAVKKLGEQLAPLDEIHELVSIAYPHDLMTIVRTRNMNDCYDFTRKLYRFEDLVKTRTTLVFETTEEVS